MGDNVALFCRFYVRPVRATSEALDKGSLAFAILLAVLTLVVWGWAGPFFGVPLPRGEAFPPAALMMAALRLMLPGLLILAALFLGLVPVAIAVIAARDGLGSASVILRREYAGVAIAGLFAWCVAYLPFGLLSHLLAWFGFAVLAHGVFVLLLVITLRTALGTDVGTAAAAAAVGWLVALGFVLIWPVIGGFSYFLLSPWILYLLYRAYSPDVRALGDAVQSRRSFRRQLETSMVNPRDADAHYQLGLLYEQRRQYDEAAASFRRAVAIQPDEAESHLHLGRALRSLRQPAEALPHLQAALKIDARVSRYEAWRDLGAALLELGRATEACAALEQYTNAREYDPEGLFYYGQALQEVGRSAEARAAFEQAIAAVDSAPKYQRGQLRSWARKAASALRR